MDTTEVATGVLEAAAIQVVVDGVQAVALSVGAELPPTFKDCGSMTFFLIDIFYILEDPNETFLPRF